MHSEGLDQIEIVGVIRQLLVQDPIDQMSMRMAGKGLAELLHQGAIGMPKFGGFAQAVAIRVRMQGQATACLAQGVAFGVQARLEFFPGSRLAEICREECPQGREEPLIRPIGRLRIPCTSFDFIRYRVALAKPTCRLRDPEFDVAAP